MNAVLSYLDCSLHATKVSQTVGNKNFFGVQIQLKSWGLSEWFRKFEFRKIVFRRLGFKKLNSA